MSPDELYTRIYDALCGRQHAERPWHFLWHGGAGLRRELAQVLRGLGGRVLDLGCGTAPYRSCFRGGLAAYTGADVAPGPGVDVLLTPGEPLPFAPASFDTVLSTQVLEHVADLPQAFAEMVRVLRPGGTLVLTVPFLYGLHGEPHDYRRFTEFGLAALLEGNFQDVRITRIGGVGGSCAIMLLSWLYFAANQTRAGRYLKALLLPAWIGLSLLVNLAALGLDRLDSTGRYPHALVAVARKRQE